MKPFKRQQKLSERDECKLHMFPSRWRMAQRTTSKLKIGHFWGWERKDYRGFEKLLFSSSTAIDVECAFQFCLCHGQFFGAFWGLRAAPLCMRTILAITQIWSTNEHPTGFSSSPVDEATTIKRHELRKNNLSGN